ncbi:MAG: nuclear transport factor 2 family protein [Cyanobacteriota bacterium]|nr:nuclear transport factor 2 family protein [Cyanobacteriota bacterium]
MSVSSQVSSNNIKIVQNYYQATNTGNLETILSTLHPEFQLYEVESLPYKGTWEGHQGATEFFSAFMKTWENPRMEGLEFFDIGSEVVVRFTLKATAKNTSKVIEMPITEFIKVKDGKVIEILPFYQDTAKIAEVIN